MSNENGSGDDVADGACVADALSTMLLVIECVSEGLAHMVADLEDDRVVVLVCERLPLGVRLRVDRGLSIVDGVELLVGLPRSLAFAK